MIGITSLFVASVTTDTSVQVQTLGFEPSSPSKLTIVRGGFGGFSLRAACSSNTKSVKSQ